EARTDIPNLPGVRRFASGAFHYPPGPLWAQLPGPRPLAAAAAVLHRATRQPRAADQGPHVPGRDHAHPGQATAPDDGPHRPIHVAAPSPFHVKWRTSQTPGYSAASNARLT